MSTNESKSDSHDATFEYAIYRIASSFVSLDDRDTIINNALASLGEACRAGRSYLFLFNHAAGLMDNTHEWCAPGVEPSIDMLKDLPIAMFPWWMERLGRGEQIHIPEVRRLGPEAQAERDILEAQNIESVLVLPIYEEQVFSGFIGLDDVTSPGTWAPQTEEYLRVASEMVSSTLTRARREWESEQRTEELRHAYEDLKETQVRLLQAEKLASIGMLAAGVAHEINNPIGFVKSNTLSLRDYLHVVESVVTVARDGACSDDFVEAVEKAELDFVLSDIREVLRSNEEGLERITAIVRNLMGFARSGQDDQFAPADINASIRAALAVAGGTVRNAATVDFIEGELPAVECNAGELNQVFLNVLFNAAQAIEEHASGRHGTIRITTSADDVAVTCIFEDDGPGIPAEQRQRLFEPFFTTKEVGKGTGLGMSIAYDIVVKKHGGEIVAEESELGGARIRITIPLVPPSPPTR